MKKRRLKQYLHVAVAEAIDWLRSNLLVALHRAEIGIAVPVELLHR